MNKLTEKRVLIFLGFSFVLVWAVMIPYYLSGGEYTSSTSQFIMVYSMFCPAISVLITKKITKEKGSLLLGINFKERKWSYYILAILLPVILSETGYLIYYFFATDAYNPDNIIMYGLTKKIMPLYIVSSIITCIINSALALGEEIGWRVYLYPKLEELFGLKFSMIIGGLIWGIWHYPALLNGHSFGTGYKGEPWTGLLLFTFNCILMGIILYYITRKTGSIWPAAFFHSVDNGCMGYFKLCLSEERAGGILSDSVVGTAIISIPMFVLGIVIFFIMCYTSTCKKTEQELLK